MRTMVLSMRHPSALQWVAVGSSTAAAGQGSTRTRRKRRFLPVGVDQSGGEIGVRSRKV